MNISAFQDEPLFRRHYLILPPCRKEKIDRLKPEGERCRSLGAGLLLKRACEEYGIPGEDGHLTQGEYGKPAFSCCPEVHFSLSHSGEYVLCVMALREAGCDVEGVKPFCMQVAERVFTEEELWWLNREAENGRGDEAFCRLWTLKESFLKLTGKGLSFPMKEASFAYENGEIRFSLHGERTEAFHFYELSFLPDYCVSVCLAGEEAGQLQIIPVDYI